jgi:thioredoxin reductase
MNGGGGGGGASAMPPPPPTVSPRIAIIGGGAAGLAAARALSRNAVAMQLDVLERDKDMIGGVWNYPCSTSPQHEKTRPMYRHLRTNLPKEIMAYRELPWRGDNSSNGENGNEEASFVTHTQVAAYLQRYCGHFELDRLFRRGCHVVQLTCLPHTVSRIQSLQSLHSESLSPLHSWPQIRLDWTTSCHGSQDKLQSQVYDAVVICNGHYSVPAYPTIPGIEYFKGNTLHSIAYDCPEPFTDQTVLCIGARASGSDLAREISAVARTVYLSDSAFPVANETTTMAIQQDNVVLVPSTRQILPNGRVAFASSTAAVDEGLAMVQSVEVDTIIFCTGYDYSFPFINDQSNLKFETSQRRVQPLFEQLWHAEYPNIAFVGLPHSVVPFPLFELQAQAVERSWRPVEKDGDDTNDDDSPSLLNAALLRANAARDAESGGPLAGRVPQDTHYLGSAQWEYCRRMARYAGILDQETEDYIATNQVRISVCAFWPRRTVWGDSLVLLSLYMDRPFMTIPRRPKVMPFQPHPMCIVRFAISAWMPNNRSPTTVQQHPKCAQTEKQNSLACKAIGTLHSRVAHRSLAARRKTINLTSIFGA